MTRPSMNPDEIALLRAMSSGQEYADMAADLRALVDRAAAAIRAGDRAPLQAMLDRTMSVGAADAVAIGYGVRTTDDMRVADIARAIQTAAADPAARIAHSVTALPLPAGPSGGRWSPADATTTWLRSRRSEHTRRAYFRDLSGWLGWLHDAGLDPLQVTRPDVDTYLARLRERAPAPSPATINRILSSLSSWYGYLVDAEVTVRNPVTAVDRPPLDRDFSPTIGLTVAEVRELLRAADTAVTTATGTRRLCALRNQALLGVLTGLGLRVGEALGLDVADLGHNSGHRTVVVRGKGGRRRQLPIPARLATHLDAYLAARRHRVALHRTDNLELWRRAATPGVTAEHQDFAEIPLTGPLFVTLYTEISRERRLRQNYVFELVQRLAREAGLPAANRISPHSLRHSAATAALDDGVPLRDVQDFLGHADPRTTRRYDRNRGSLDRSPAHRLGTLYAE